MTDRLTARASFPDPNHDHGRCAAELMRRAEQTCARRGARLTSLRRDVLGAVGESHRAAGAYDIIERLARSGSRPAPISIYRALDFLSRLGLVHRIESRNAFIACSNSRDNGRALLMICEDCSTVGEVEGGSVFADLKALAAAKGFETRRAIIELSGRCDECRTIEP